MTGVSRTLTHLVVSVALLMAIVRPGAAQQDNAPQRARELYNQGVTEFRAGDYAAALVSFQAGYALDPKPEFLLNIAQCHRASGNAELAIQFFERFVQAAPNHQHRRAAELALNELRAAPPQPVAPVEPTPAPTPAEPAPEPASTSDARIPPGADLSTLASNSKDDGSGPARPWLWLGVGAAVVAGAVAVYFVSRPDAPPEVFDTIQIPETR